MKREILFRGQSTDSKEWIEGEFSNLFSKADICLWTSDDGKSCLRYYPVKEETVGEYIQRTDKHGKKVFEGDVLRFLFRNEKEYYLVEYVDENMTCGIFLRDFQTMRLYPIFSQDIFKESIEVIGNRWDMTTDDMVKLGFIKSEVRHG